MLFDLSFISTLSAFGLIIWFRTEAVKEYFELFNMTHLFKLNEFIDYKKNINSSVDYPDFLLSKYNNFLTRLLSCPFCLNFWFNLILCSILGIYYFPITYILSLTIYFILNKISL
jgi:hypothetical protein